MMLPFARSATLTRPANYYHFNAFALTWAQLVALILFTFSTNNLLQFSYYTFTSKSHQQLLVVCPQWRLKTVSTADDVECRIWWGWIVFHGDSADLGSEFWRASKTTMGYVCNSRTGKGDLLVSDEFRTEIDGPEQIRWCALSTLDGNRIDLNELFQGFSITTVFPRSSLNIPCSIELEAKSWHYIVELRFNPVGFGWKAYQSEENNPTTYNGSDIRHATWFRWVKVTSIYSWMLPCWLLFLKSCSSFSTSTGYAKLWKASDLIWRFQERCEWQILT